jgi:DNA (cytosine-5)-methyltransferase 1
MRLLSPDERKPASIGSDTAIRVSIDLQGNLPADWTELLTRLVGKGVSENDQEVVPCLRSAGWEIQPYKKLKMAKLSSIELFTGAGGLALATHGAGFRHLGLYEWNRDACATLRKNAKVKAVSGISAWSSRVHEGDVSDVDFSSVGSVDLVAGGPPCQPFSIGGKARGYDDRRDMIPQFIRAVRETAPRAFIMENVKGLTRPAFRNYVAYTTLQLTYPGLAKRAGEFWQEHLSRLERHHTSTRKSIPEYRVIPPCVLNAANFGVPQCRERVFIVGFRSDVAADWSFPVKTHSKDSLYFDQWISGDYWRRHGLAVPESQKVPAATKLESLANKGRPAELPWVSIRDAISDLPDPRETDQFCSLLNHRFQPGAKSYPGHTGSPIDFPSKTLKAGDHGVPGGENMISFPDGAVRYLTVREAARVQTFPDTWRLEGAWTEVMRQLGNAVPVTLAQVVASSVGRALARNQTESN